MVSAKDGTKLATVLQHTFSSIPQPIHEVSCEIWGVPRGVLVCQGSSKGARDHTSGGLSEVKAWVCDVGGRPWKTQTPSRQPVARLFGGSPQNGLGAPFGLPLNRQQGARTRHSNCRPLSGVVLNNSLVWIQGSEPGEAAGRDLQSQGSDIRVSKGPPKMFVCSCHFPLLKPPPGRVPSKTNAQATSRTWHLDVPEQKTW